MASQESIALLLMSLGHRVAPHLFSEPPQRAERLNRTKFILLMTGILQFSAKEYVLVSKYTKYNFSRTIYFSKMLKIYCFNTGTVCMYRESYLQCYN